MSSATEHGALFISSSETMVATYRTALQRVSLACRSAPNLAQFRAEADPGFALDALVVDLDGAEGARGMDLLKETLALRPGVPTIVLASQGSINVAVEAMRLGADNFLVKPAPPEKLVRALKEARERIGRRRTDRRPQTPLHDFFGFLGESPAMQAVFREIEAVAPSSATVFVTGESGVGKEVAAETIHKMSGRASGPFVAINCGAIPGELISSELFGHLKGSFTGAVADRIGAVKQADGGTLFLDEICEMRLDLQTELLRFLQTGSLRPVGATRTEKVDVRILCATNRDPRREVAEKRFREDLFYRLHVVPLHLPPLRERGQDLVLLAEAFLKRFASENRRKPMRFSPDAYRKLKNHRWPGNVRELQNVVQNAVVMHDDEVIEAAMLRIPDGEGSVGNIEVQSLRGMLDAMRDHGGADVARGADVVGPRHPDLWSDYDHILPLADLEAAAIGAATRICKGNVNRAAFHLGVSPSTIYRKKLKRD